jgi:cytochrome P450
MTTTQLPPMAPRLPVLGNALAMAGDIQRFLVAQHRALGPVFRVRALNQAFTIMAGQEANQFLHRHGEEHFSSQDTMGGLDREFGMRVHVLTGAPHRRLRKTLGGAISRDLLAARWDTFSAHTEDRIRAWRPGSPLRVVDQCQRLAADQLSSVLTGAATTDRFEQLRSAFELVLDVTVAGKWPRAALRLPAYRRAREEIRAFAGAALADRAARPHDGRPDLLDHILAATDENGRPYPPEVQAGMALQGYFAGINTVAYLYSFLVYALLRHPTVHQRVTEEVDASFSDGRLPFERLRSMALTQRLVMETLRLYPPAPGSTRTVVKPFEFGGCHIGTGTRVLVATTVPHHLPEHYADPDAFDLDRDFTDSRRKGVYAPFSVGGHTCLGAGITELLATATVAHLVRNVRLRLPSPDHRIRIRATPGPNPGKRFTVTVLGSR